MIWFFIDCKTLSYLYSTYKPFSIRRSQFRKIEGVTDEVMSQRQSSHRPASILLWTTRFVQAANINRLCRLIFSDTQDAADCLRISICRLQNAYTLTFGSLSRRHRLTACPEQGPNLEDSDGKATIAQAFHVVERFWPVRIPY